MAQTAMGAVMAKNCFAPLVIAPVRGAASSMRLRMTRRVMAFVVITSLGGGCSPNNSPASQDFDKAELLIVTAPIWIPAALVVCATGGCKTEKGQPVTVSGTVGHHDITPDSAILAAAEKGDPQAQYQLGQAYEVNFDFAIAATWYRKSAEQGYGKAQYRLAGLYEGGDGVEKDYVQADMWYLVAATSGGLSASEVKWANEHSEDLERRMTTPEQIAEARRRAQEWKPTPSGANAQAQPAN